MGPAGGFFCSLEVCFVEIEENIEEHVGGRSRGV